MKKYKILAFHVRDAFYGEDAVIGRLIVSDHVGTSSVGKPWKRVPGADWASTPAKDRVDDLYFYAVKLREVK
jgi:hypothetical protein